MLCSGWVLWGIVVCGEGVVCNECILVIVRCQIVSVCVFAEELVLLIVLVRVGVWGCLGVWEWEVLLVQPIARRRRSVSWLGRGGRKGLVLALPTVWLVAVAAVFCVSILVANGFASALVKQVCCAILVCATSCACSR